MKQTVGRQVVSTLLVRHIVLLQHLHEPPSPVSTTRPMWLTSDRISHEAVYVGRRQPAGAGPRAGAGPAPACGPAPAPARWLYVTMGYTNVVAVALAKTAATVHKCAFSPNCWGTGGG